MATKRKSRRVEVMMQELTTPRRSPRLSQKHKPSSLASHNLLTSTSRPNIRTYTKSKTPESVLNESGQLVPDDFDEGDNYSVASSVPESLRDVQHDHTYFTGTTYTAGVRSAKQTYSDTARTNGVPYGVGLDISDKEESDGEANCSKNYNYYEKESTILTTPPKPRPRDRIKASIVSVFRGFISSTVYLIGSLVYLFASFILVGDTLLLKKRIYSRTNYNDSNGRNFCLLFAIFVLVGILLTVPHTRLPERQEPPPPPVVAPIIRTVTTTSVVTPSPSPDSAGMILDQINRLEIDQNAKLERLNQEILVVMKQTIDAAFDKHPALARQTDELKALLETRLSQHKDELLAQLKLISDTESSKLSEELKRFKHLIADMTSETLNEWTLNQPASDSNVNIPTVVQEIVDATVDPLKALVQQNTDQIRENDEKVSKELNQIKSSLQKVHDDWSKKLEDLGHKYQKLLEESASKQSKGVDDLSSDLNNKISATTSKMDELQKELKSHGDIIIKLEQMINNFQPTSPSTGLTEAQVRHLIDSALYNYSADQIGRFDFALESAGAQVVDHSKTYDPSNTKPQIFGFTLPITLSRSSPSAVLQPSVMPGNGWCFEGQEGHILIKLAGPVIIDAVTLQHIPKDISPFDNIDNAPKEFDVSGKNSIDDEGKLLGSFTYKSDSAPIQTFDLPNQERAFSYAQFQFTRNQGNVGHTCVYRVRVHGKYQKP